MPATTGVVNRGNAKIIASDGISCRPRPGTACDGRRHIVERGIFHALEDILYLRGADGCRDGDNSLPKILTEFSDPLELSHIRHRSFYLHGHIRSLSP